MVDAKYLYGILFDFWFMVCLQCSGFITFYGLRGEVIYYMCVLVLSVIGVVIMVPFCTRVYNNCYIVWMF